MRKSDSLPKISKSFIVKKFRYLAEKNPLTLGTVIANPVVNSRSNEAVWNVPVLMNYSEWFANTTNNHADE